MYNVFKGGDIMKKRRSVYCTDEELLMIKALLCDTRYYAEKQDESPILKFVMDEVVLVYALRPSCTEDLIV